MNRSKQSIFNKLRKSMTKSIKKARNILLSPESKKDSDTFTAKELRKKFPKKSSRKKENLAKALQRKDARLARAKKNPSGLHESKRTAPGGIETQSPPSYPHKEGSRWIKNLNQKIRNQKVIAAHHGDVKK